MLQGLFFVSILIVLYIYAGYPLLTLLLSKSYDNAPEKDSIEPGVTIVIAAFNEEDVIADTIRNKLDLDYPGDKLDIVVVSDGSTDRTDAIVDSFTDRKVRLLRQEPRSGKTSALNMAIRQIDSEIVVFSDANSLYEVSALRQLVANFADPDVGYVTGKMIYVNADGTPDGDGCSAYMKYENYLRAFESKIGSVVGVDGGIDAMRRSLYQPLMADQLPDFVQPLKVVEQGFRVVYEQEAILKEVSLNSSEDEYRMRVRVSLRAFWALFDMRQLLFYKNNFIFSWQLWSHKLLRYLCFIFLLSLFLSNLLLLRSGKFYVSCFCLQTICYFVSFIPLKLEYPEKLSKLLILIRYFVLLNSASMHAFIKFVLKQKQITWTPRKG
jgi:cellulose synthase/poly-beta-1,6-N-acetylglucosamine synthase-like glycosyltransferase